MSKLSYEKISSLLSYRDGDLLWIAPTKGRRISGSKAGTLNPNTGAVAIEIQGNNYPAHHIVWLLEYGSWPEKRVTHINGDRADNRIENLKMIDSSKEVVDAALARKIFRYESGTLYWKALPNQYSRVTIGEVAGFVGKQKHHQYRRIKIFGKGYKAADLVWLYHHGSFPTKMLDHINHVTTDDSIENLREATPRENARNRSVTSRSSTGILGVTKRGEKWVARISGNDGGRIHLGEFKTKAEASAARKIAQRVLGYHINHGRAP